ncbi:MAG: hypothetical protein EA352_01745 [Gemmatimonadales bacterium]|nr:MAG: hypothetical protein EA352_01745 [Gemmatimonadales bacterium]
MDGQSRRRLPLLGLLLVLAVAACDRTPPDPAANDSSHALVVDSLFSLDVLAVHEVPGSGPRVAMNPGGDRFVYAPSTSPQALHLFDSTGAWVEGFGGRGEGPGEFRQIDDLAFGAGDSLWVFTPSHVDIWSPELAHARSVPLPFPVRKARRAPSGDMFIVGMDRTPGAEPSLVHRLQPDGQISPIAPETSPLDPAEPINLEGSLTPAPDGSLWIAGFQDYDIRHVTPGGDLASRIDAAPTWWGVSDEVEPDTQEWMATHSALLDLTLDEGSNLWVVAGIPKPENLDPIRDAGLDPNEMNRAMIDHFRSAADHVIRVYGADQELLVEEHFDYMPLRFLGGNLAYTVEPDSLVGWGVVVRRIEVTSDAGAPDG